MTNWRFWFIFISFWPVTYLAYGWKGIFWSMFILISIVTGIYSFEQAKEEIEKEKDARK